MRKQRAMRAVLGAVIAVTLAAPAASATEAPQSSPPVNPDLTAGEDTSLLTVEQQQQRCQQQARSTTDYECVVLKKKEADLPALQSSPQALKQLHERSVQPDQGSPSQVEDPPGIDPECNNSGVANPSRFVACTGETFTAEHLVFVGGRPQSVGELSMFHRSSVEFDQSFRSPSWELDAEITVGEGRGTLMAGVPGRIWTGCLNAARPDRCNSTQLGDDNREDEPAMFSPGTTVRRHFTQLGADMDNNEVLTLNQNLGIGMQLYTAPNPVTTRDFTSNTLTGRCDNAPYVSGTGCVNDEGPALVLYDTRANPGVGPVAQHVVDAIRTLPSHWGSPYGNALTRLTDRAAIDRNRRITCRGGDPSCDEYPLATTYQGGDGAAPDDRSTRTVPIGANRSQGGLTNANYDRYRVLDRDSFYVQAVLADGTPAW